MSSRVPLLDLHMYADYSLTERFQNGTVLSIYQWGAVMPTLTIKNIPIPLVKRLKTQATRHRRSLNLEVIACLETVTHSTPVDVDRLLADVRHLRPSLHHARLTNRLIDRFKTHGRP